MIPNYFVDEKVVVRTSLQRDGHQEDVHAFRGVVHGPGPRVSKDHDVDVLRVDEAYLDHRVFSVDEDEVADFHFVKKDIFVVMGL